MAMTPRDTLEFLRARRSLRRYRPEPVPQRYVEQLLEAATWAPSAHNRQPWRFAISQEAGTKRRLAREMGALLRRDLTADGVASAVIEADVQRSYQRISGAPLLIVLCVSMRDMDVYTDEERRAHERTMAQQSVAMAGQNMLLMASSLGLGACWVCAPLFCQGLVRTVLDLPDDWQPQGMITLGYATEQRQRGREPWETRVLWR